MQTYILATISIFYYIWHWSLDPWNVIYNGVYKLEISENDKIVGFVDGITIVIDTANLNTAKPGDVTYSRCQYFRS